MPSAVQVVPNSTRTRADVSGDRGRHVAASTDLAVGDLVLRTEAAAAVLLPELWRSHCHKCFSNTPSLSRCGRCRTAYYCSRACQQQDWQPDHRRECKRLAQLASLGLRSDQVVDVLLLGRVMRRTGQEVDGVSPLDLVWYQEDMMDQELLLLAGLAQKLELVDGGNSIEQLQRMLSRFRNNNFSICDELLLEVGAGCFPLGAMVNHSCDPNCAVTFVSKALKMEFRAMKPIKAGEEVTQTYVDIALPRRERQQRLQRKYHFHCSCSRCSQSLQDPESVDAFLDADSDGVPQEQWTPQRQECVERSIQELREATDQAANALDTVKKQQQHIDALKQLLVQQGNTLHRYNISLLQTYSTLFSAEMERDSVNEAILYGESILEFYRHVYNANHPMTGLHLFTLGDLHSQLVQMEAGDEHKQAKASEYLMEAHRILQITHGKDHRFVQMLNERFKGTTVP
ncbi:SET and MYND domain-containing protein 3 [Phytophthora boehmeriae]|uniref:SET and MYND domain-containing protein 3 n=1 Tax=Phytophthora boehmeriae TaxID=109152 RepID=A0A8T1X5D3_9STRA|nr:SET and MYND domain-containing protein 3 [Phytophthora boehmeriae]